MKNVKNLHDWIMSWLFHQFGWKIEGTLPNLNKYVIVIAPHTSNWDFCVGYTARAYLQLKANVLIKKELFKIPLVGWFLRKAGGYPVDRSKKTRMVDQIVELYDKLVEFRMTVTPEGTRSAVKEWKTGFYQIAKKAKVPILKIAFDYPTKRVIIDQLFFPTGEKDEDIKKMKNFFLQFTGKYPEMGILML